ncbi:PAS domain S-box protein [Treponema sp. J25]|uniref:hybrid sensor histidine kinase/response regulator n=1 Tax=Treponema sp. J25 TaxID=2094121 RepID=UPI00104B1B68|nr:PAS domain S-box protein [Treponema sp. J25]TCW60710.1 hypothetical protein C5O22_10220 [Treponema sp. J25]
MGTAESLKPDPDRRYLNLVEALPDIVYELDPEGHFTFVNQAVSLLGYTPEELIGKHFSAILFEEDIPYVSREYLLPLYQKRNTGARGAPKLFDERRGVPRKTENLELRLKRKTPSPLEGKEMYASIISYGEVTSAGAYKRGDTSSEPVFVGTVGIIRDITLRRKSEEMLRKMYQAVDQSPLGIAILNRDLIIEYVNPAFFSLTATGPDQVIGQKITHFILPDPSIKKNYEALCTSIESGLDWRGELRWNRAGATPLWVDFSFSAVRNPAGAITHYLCNIEDITARKTLEELSIQARDAAEEAHRAKEEFISHWSSQIQNPLLELIMVSEKLRHSGNYEDEVAQEIQKKCRELLATLDDFSLFFAPQGEILHFYPEEVLLSKDIEETLLPYKNEATERGLSWSIHIDDGGFPMVRMDFTKIRKILSVLVTNALTHTSAGGIQISCHVRAKEQIPALFVSVKDTGSGFSGEEQQHLFTAPGQNNGEKALKKESYQEIGLPLIKKLIERMGGAISVESTPGVGSIFSFFVPLEVTSFPVSPSPGRSPSSPLLILIGEQNPVNQEYFRHILEKAGHQVFFAVGQKAILALLESRDFDCLIVDIQEPEVEGLQTVMAIRSSHSQHFDPSLPIIGLGTIEGKQGLPSRSFFDALLPKPVTIQHLVQQIETLTLHRLPLNIERLRRIYAGSEEDLRHLLMTAHTELPKYLTSLEGAYESQDTEKIRQSLQHMVNIFAILGNKSAENLIKRYYTALTNPQEEEQGTIHRRLVREAMATTHHLQRILEES